MSNPAHRSYSQFPLRRFVHEMTDGPFGSSLTSSHYSDEGARVIRLGNIGSARFKNSDEVFISLDYFNELKRHEVKSGDLLIAGLGDERHPVGRACIAPDDLGPAIVKADCYRVRLDEKRLTHRFAAWALCSSYVADQVSASSRGSTRSRINLEVAREIVLPVPHVEEQRRIADFLDAETARIDRLSSLQQQVVHLLDERESAQLDLAIDELVGRHSDVPLRRFLWGVDQGTSPQCEAVPAGENEWGVLKVSSLRPGLFLPHENKRLPEGVEPDRTSEVHDGDLLITRANTPQLVGSTAVVRGARSKLLLSDKIFRVRLTREMSPDFVAAVARGSRIRALCAAGSNGASQSMANIRFDEVKAWPLPAVGPDLQRDLVHRSSRARAQLDALRKKVNRQLHLLAERRQALITAAVTGQIDVSTASGRDIED
ncbi:restriction endonuclease subunit S [Streptomyces sp. HPF1205]|uniref:restriction endonuclease subunit S n=1 Tax=Streptomyces sp. HPF1205 TaxID=2873262 RepID=UPI001CEC33D5|nr:restriction endonuclease subunit S [Streptomyces sp. HPF1205]